MPNGTEWKGPAGAATALIGRPLLAITSVREQAGEARMGEYLVIVDLEVEPGTSDEIVAHIWESARTRATRAAHPVEN
jgi:hypothetical protein